MRESSQTASPERAELRILRRRQVEERVGLSCSTIYAAITAGTFPKPIRLGAQSVGWLESEIMAWLRERVAASRGKARRAREANSIASGHFFSRQ